MKFQKKISFIYFKAKFYVCTVTVFLHVTVEFPLEDKIRCRAVAKRNSLSSRVHSEKKFCKKVGGKKKEWYHGYKVLAVTPSPVQINPLKVSLTDYSLQPTWMSCAWLWGKTLAGENDMWDTKIPNLATQGQHPYLFVSPPCPLPHSPGPSTEQSLKSFAEWINNLLISMRRFL